MSDSQSSAALKTGTTELIAATVRDHWGQRPDPALPDVVRLPLSVLTAIKNRSRALGTDSDPEKPAIFVMCEYPGRVREHFVTERAPLFSNGTSQLLGRVWFTNCDLTTGHFIEPQSSDVDIWFREIEDQENYGKKPTVLVDPRVKPWEFRYYPRGLSDESTCYRYEIDSADVDVDTLNDVLTRFHQTHLETPECSGLKIWSDPAQHVPIERPERNIQHDLHIYLSGKFSGCMIRSEETSKAGRADLVIWEKLDEGHITRAVFELKVLRSKWASGAPATGRSNLRAVAKGVKQSLAYKQQLGCSIAFVCLYDMQRDNRPDEVMTQVTRIQNYEEIEIRRWFCFHSAEEWRNATYPET